MNTLVKVLIGVAAVGAVAATTYVVVKKNEEKKDVVDTDSNDIPKEAEEKKTTLKERIKDKVNKKMVRVFTWILINKNKIESAAAVISLLAAVLNVVNKAKNLATGLKLQKTMESICEWQDNFGQHWDNTIDAYNNNFNVIYDAIGDVKHTLKEGA